MKIIVDSGRFTKFEVLTESGFRYQLIRNSSCFERACLAIALPSFHTKEQLHIQFMVIRQVLMEFIWVWVQLFTDLSLVVNFTAKRYFNYLKIVNSFKLKCIIVAIFIVGVIIIDIIMHITVTIKLTMVIITGFMVCFIGVEGYQVDFHVNFLTAIFEAPFIE